MHRAPSPGPPPRSGPAPAVRTDAAPDGASPLADGASGGAGFGARLDVAVIHFRTPAVLADAVPRVRASAPAARLLVVDVAPPDEAAAEGVRRLAATSGAEVLRVPNHSLAAAVCAALRATSRPLFAHMNADVLVEPDTLPALARALEAPRPGPPAAMAGPVCRLPDGRLQSQGLPWDLHPRRLRLSGRDAVRVGWLSGCLQMVRREDVALVGGMDASLRFYNEDLEWCERLRRAGRACLLVATPAVHLGGAATPPDDPRFRIEGYRGGVIVSRRYRPAWYLALHLAFVRAEAAWRSRRARRAHVREAYAAIARMARDGDFDESPFGDDLGSSNPRFDRAPERAAPLRDRG